MGHKPNCLPKMSKNGSEQVSVDKVNRLPEEAQQKPRMVDSSTQTEPPPVMFTNCKETQTDARPRTVFTQARRYFPNRGKISILEQPVTDFVSEPTQRGDTRRVGIRRGGRFPRRGRGRQNRFNENQENEGRMNMGDLMALIADRLGVPHAKGEAPPQQPVRSPPRRSPPPIPPRPNPRQTALPIVDHVTLDRLHEEPSEVFTPPILVTAKEEMSTCNGASLRRHTASGLSPIVGKPIARNPFITVCHPSPIFSVCSGAPVLSAPTSSSVSRRLSPTSEKGELPHQNSKK